MKIFTTIACSALAVAFASCGSSPKKTEDPDRITVACYYFPNSDILFYICRFEYLTLT